MEFSTKTAKLENLRTSTIVAGVYAKRALSDSAKILDKASGGHISNILKKGDLAGRPGQSMLLHDVPGLRAERVLLVGMGARKSVDESTFNSIVVTTITRLKETNSRSAILCLLERRVAGRNLEWRARQIVEAIEYHLYSFTEMKGKKPTGKPALTSISLHVAERRDKSGVDKAIAVAAAIARGVTVARDLGNLPSNVCTPAYLARQARKIGRDSGAITTRVIEEAEMKRLGMGAFLAVTAGSNKPGKLIVMHYRGTKRSEKPYVIVGKGLCFDSGGISIKPPAAMGEMIYDMCGAASVFGALTAVAQMELPINLVAVVAAAENMPSATATKPGDIVKSMSGQTIEISNTDAEGRLVLCDALTYIDRFKPRTVIDIATLTGAVIVALGSQASGLMSNDDKLAGDLEKASDYSRDRVWRLPIWDEYQSQLASAHADMNNVGGRPAGTIVAGCFLARYTKKYRWAHVDIAGTAYVTGPRKSSTGRPVSLLTQYLLDQALLDQAASG